LIENDPDNKEAYNNLGVISFQNRELEKAINYFDNSLRLDPFYKDAVLNYSCRLNELNLLHKGVPYLEKISKEFPGDEEISRLLSEARQELSAEIKVAVLCSPGLQSFLVDIVDFLKTKCDVRTCFSNNNTEIESAIRWADIVWLEWANELAIHVSNKVPSVSNKQVICRIHS
jgi:tetratricopeptide (TPR) repeat protein